jgi:hypothetical protein
VVFFFTQHRRYTVVRRLLLLFALFTFAAPVGAQEPTPGQLRAAERLVSAMRLESNWAPTQEQFMRQIHERLSDTSGVITESERSIREMFAKRFTWERMKPEYVRLYGSLYTEDELRQLTAFYESPVGQKSQRIAPEVATRIFGIVQRLMAPDAP